ncbi:MAG: C40 family peptidase [Erysipelotrichaceae bacterium]|nr:C40 family peptidase [Erysipelotrichaceae bacterium]
MPRVVDEAIKTTKNTYQAMGGVVKTAKDYAGEMSGQAMNYAVNYGKDVYEDVSDNFGEESPKVIASNAAMGARGVYRGAQSGLGVVYSASSKGARKLSNLARRGGYARTATFLDRRSAGLKRRSANKYKKGWSRKRIKSSMRATVRNQSRKAMNQVSRQPDSATKSIGMSARTVKYGARGLRTSRKAAKKTVKVGWSGVKKTYKFFRHPVKGAHAAAQAAKQSIISIISAIVSLVVTTLTSSVFLSIIIVVIAIIVAIVMFISSIFSIFFNDEANKCSVYNGVKVCDTGNKVKDLANETAITARNSEQYQLLFEDKYGRVEHDEWGLAYIEEHGIKYYCNALATYYTSEIGSKFKVTLESGVVIYTITCDIKADKHTHKGNNDDSPNCLSGDGSMLEFYGLVKEITQPKLRKAGFGSIGNDLDKEHMWKSPVKSIEAMQETKSCVAASKEYVRWMIEIANDDSHGYSQSRRSGGIDYDCSSFVYYALLNNGMTTEQLTTYPFTTWTMGSILKSAGFKEYTYDEIRHDLHEGDILVSNVSGLEHTETYVGNGMTVGAHAGDQDGKRGDSSGNEISIIPNSTHESLNGGNYWQYVYRPSSS